MSYVLACGDEGVQLNEGTRLGVVGAGFRVEHFDEVMTALRKLFPKNLVFVSNDENTWVKQILNLDDWDQVNASMQQHVEALADREKLKYAGHIPFTDPKQLKYGVKGHMVRPHGVHIANKICFTLAGGEQKFNLGCYVISAEWVSEVSKAVAKSVIETQVEFYKSLAKKDLQFIFEESGDLGEAVAEKNKKVLASLGIQ